ncbi:hypothetical protein BDI4_580031 [Burkholderia diffusa]|nr:hypothetical protein BDI4_580031 [Burkholderia diffusa]
MEAHISNHFILRIGYHVIEMGAIQQLSHGGGASTQGYGEVGVWMVAIFNARQSLCFGGELCL